MNENTALPGSDIDPDIRKFVRIANEAYARLSEGKDLTIPRMREIAEEVRAPWRAGGPEMADTSEFRIGPSLIRVRHYRPVVADRLPVLIYIHGGGWTNFSLDTHDRLMREYAARSGGAVLGIDYSLSPENPFPRALEELAEVLQWIAVSGERVGIDPDRVAVGGDSAGANLSLAVSMLARDRGLPMPRAMLLNYGAFDETRRASHDRYGSDAYMLTPDEMDWFWRNYRGEERGPDPLATPLHGEFHDLPPAFLCIAECDILADENMVVAEKLMAAGGDVTARVYAGATHSFLEAMSISPLAERALDEASDWLKAVWSQ